MSANNDEEMSFFSEEVFERRQLNSGPFRSASTSSSASSHLQADSLALYHAVGEGHGRMLVEAFGRATQNAILAASFASDFTGEGPRDDSMRNEEKVDEFYLERHFPMSSSSGSYDRSSSPSSFSTIRQADPKHRGTANWKGFFSTAGVGLLNPSWIRQYTRTSSFVLGSFYMQNMIHHPWASSSMHERHVSLNDVNDIMKRCEIQARANIHDLKLTSMSDEDCKKAVASLDRASSQNVNNRSVRDAVWNKNQTDAHLRDGNNCPCLYDEDVRYLSRVLSNVRPPTDYSFTTLDAARKTKKLCLSYRSNNESEQDVHKEESSSNSNDGVAGNILFDGSHGANNGTLLHLACVADSPLALALLLTLGGDPTTRFTAFRRLPIHEAACCGSTLCLTLLLEFSNFLEQQESANMSDVLLSNATKQMEVSSSNALPSSPYLKKPYLIDNIQENDYNFFMDSKPAAAHETPSTSEAKKCKNQDDIVTNRFSLPPSECYGKHSFIDIMSLVLTLQSKIDDGKMTQLDAARSLINRVGVPNSIRQSMIAMLPISTATDGHGNTALHWAAFKNEVEAVRVLLTHGADANVRANHSGWTPLHDAAYSDSAEAVTLLINAGARLDARSNSGATPLCFAAQEDSPNAVEALLRAGADPGVQCCGHNAHANLAERTFLNDAADAAQPDQETEELTNNSNGENVNSAGDHTVRRNNRRFFQNMERGTGRLRQRLEHQLPLRLMFVPSRFSGYTPLHYCAHYNAYEAAKVLLRYNAPMEVEDMSSRRPIHVAAARGSSDVLRELLKAGACVETISNTINKHGIIYRTSQRQISTSPASPSTAMPPRVIEPTSAPSRLQNSFRVVAGANSMQHPQGRALQDNSATHAQGPRDYPAVPPLPLGDENNDGNENEESTESFVPFVPFPGSPPTSNVSSPVLKAMIPSRPVSSNKPWNCLTQKAIDECNQLIAAAEGHWSPQTHQVFSPADRRGVLELLRVGKRLEQQGTGIFLELWPVVLSFCGRGWFEREYEDENMVLSISENVARATTPFHLNDVDESIHDEDVRNSTSGEGAVTKQDTTFCKSTGAPQHTWNLTQFGLSHNTHSHYSSSGFTQFHFDDLESVNDERMTGDSSTSEMSHNSDDDDLNEEFTL